MAKDPAFLFYSNDFTSGTQFFTNEEVGIYIRLMCAQHQHGRLSEKQVLFICNSLDCEVLKKFTKDDSGLYYNLRLENEIERRKKFSESRATNRLGKTKDKNNTRKTYVNHMETETETEIINKNKKRKKVFIAPTELDVVKYFIEKGYTETSGKRAYEYYNSSDWVDSKGNKVINWKQKMLSVWFKDENKQKAYTTPIQAR